MTNNVNKVRRIKIEKLKEVALSPSYRYEDYRRNSLLELLREMEDEGEFYVGSEIEIEYQTSNGYKTLEFTTRDFDYCCEMMEFGSLSNQTFSNEDMDTLFQFLFAYCNKTVMITTISSQEDWENYLGQSKFFTLVKEFNNSNTNNMISIWISNN